jgi:phospholipid/cholesterol/gamma-HCH transport system permease protein
MPRGSLLGDGLEAIGAQALAAARGIAEPLHLLANALAGLTQLGGARGAYFRATLLQQIYFTGAQALWLVMAIGFALGILAVLPLKVLDLGGLDIQVLVLNIALFHQLVPLLVAVVVIGRSGTAVTAELGDMQVSGAIESLALMGAEPHRFLVLPRLLAFVVAMLLLTFWGNLSAIAGAAFYNELQNELGFIRVFSACIAALELLPMAQTALMVLAYGMAIGLIHCGFGLSSQSGPHVQRNLARAFVHSLCTCVAITLLFSVTTR